ncbi:hypothetical protein CR513_46139, partial [Mucuna pruriens]
MNNCMTVTCLHRVACVCPLSASLLERWRNGVMCTIENQGSIAMCKEGEAIGPKIAVSQLQTRKYLGIGLASSLCESTFLQHNI